jgi:hypothetical protein
VALAAATLLAAAPAAMAATGAPVAVTGGVRDVTFQSATLTGEVDPRGQVTTYYFQYGPKRPYASQTQPLQLPAGTRTVTVTAPISALSPLTVYHYRLVAVGSSSSSVGLDRRFETARVPLSLSIVGTPNPVTVGSPFALQGTLTGTGSANREVVLESTPFPYTAPFQQVGNPELTNADGSFSFAGLMVPFATKFEVVSVTKPAIVSSAWIENVALAVTAHAHRGRHTSRGTRVRFSGVVTPAQPGAQVAIEKLSGGSWHVIGGTSAQGASGSSRYARTIRVRRGGFFRVLVTAVNQGAYSPRSLSAPIFLRLR